MWYVIHTMSGTEQKCVQQCRQYIDPADYVEMFVPGIQLIHSPSAHKHIC